MQVQNNCFRRIAVILLLTACLGGVAAVAQSTYGSITGSVTDPSGASIPNAQVEITNQATNSVRTGATDKDGTYLVLNLDAGIYKIKIGAPGFADVILADSNLLARQLGRVDVQLKVQSVSGEHINVTADETLVSEQLTLSDSKSGKDINSLALNFRATSNTSPIIIANLAPKVQPDRQGNISIAGGLPNMTSFSVDGISTQNVRNGGPNLYLFPSVESIDEFKVNTASSDAEFGQATDLTVTTRGGGNEYHGSLFWFHQNAALNSKNTFDLKKTALVANDFGVNLGGPLSIPGLYKGKDKTFFLLTFEGTRRPQQTPINQIVPPAAWRTGDLSSISTPIINPATGRAFPNNQVPVNPVSAKVIAALFPNPDSAASTSIASANLHTSLPGNYTVNGYDVRLDHNFTSNQKAFIRFTHKNVDDLGTNGLNAGYNPKLGLFLNGQGLQNLAAAYNWIIRPNLINELRAGYSFANYVQTFPLAAQGGQLDASFGTVGLPPVPNSGGIPNFSIAGFVDTNPIGRPRHVQNHIWQWNDNLTWVKGSHTVKGGYEFRRISYVDQITFTSGDEFGDYSFNGTVTGNAFADFLLGRPNLTDFAQNGPDGRPFAYHHGVFMQDDWRVSSNFTVNYGLRYEVNPPFDDETSQLGQFDRNYPGGRLIVQGQQGLNQISPSWRQAVGNTPFVTNEQAGLPRGLRNTYYGNIQPRLGFAWSPFNNDHKTVVRSSVGAYSVPVLGSVLYSLLGVDTSNFLTFNPSASNNFLQLPNAFGGSAAAQGYPGYRRANQTDLKDPRVVQWNVTVEHELGWKTLVHLDYTGSHTTQLIYSPDLNQLYPNTVGYAALTATPALRQANLKYPNFGEVLTRDNGPSAKYNAFTVEVSRRFAKGLNFQNSFVLAKNLSNALGSAPSSLIGQGGQGDNGANAQNYFDIKSDYGNVIFTRRNRFLSTLFYDLPFGRNQAFFGHAGRAVDTLIGGWQTTGIVLLQSGPFLTPTFTGPDPSGTNPSQRSGGAFQRPDCVAGVNPNVSSPPRNGWFTPGAFVIPQNNIGRFGNCGVGILDGPGTSTFSMTLGKEFRVTEGVTLRYEAAFANLFNIVNLDVPNTRVFNGSTLDASGKNIVGNLNPAFGTITATQQGEQAGPRSIQMSLRLAF